MKRAASGQLDWRYVAKRRDRTICRIVGIAAGTGKKRVGRGSPERSATIPAKRVFS
jgi:hypothetical protein